MAGIVIFGTGDIARLAHFYFTRDSDHEVCAFTVDAEYCTAPAFLDLPLVDFAQVEQKYPPDKFLAFAALGYGRMNGSRAEVCNRLKQKGYRLTSYISTRCTFLTDYPVGENCFILEDNTIQPFVKIGNNVVLWSGNHIGHDVVIEDHCFITSHVVISGNTTVGANSFIGVTATIRNGIVIGERSLIVAGATILKSTEPDSVYAGERAKRLPKKSSEVKL